MHHAVVLRLLYTGLLYVSPEKWLLHVYGYLPGMPNTKHTYLFLGSAQRIQTHLQLITDVFMRVVVPHVNVMWNLLTTVYVGKGTPHMNQVGLMYNASILSRTVYIRAHMYTLLHQ